MTAIFTSCFGFSAFQRVSISAFALGQAAARGCWNEFSSNVTWRMSNCLRPVTDSSQNLKL
jgi:hypothetical protein